MDIPEELIIDDMIKHDVKNDDRHVHTIEKGKTGGYKKPFHAAKNKKTTKRTNTWMLAEAGIVLAMAWVLGQIKIFPMPMGGSVTAGSMVPLLVFAYRWGGKKGILVCALYGVMDFILGAKYSYHPISLIFDYPVAFGFMGVAGFFGKKTSGLMIGTVVALFGRFLCHVFSGVVVFSAYAPEGENPLVYSILYNGSYLLPELVISFILVFLLLRLAKLPEPRKLGNAA